MEKLKKVSRAQWSLFALFIGFAFLMQNCQGDDTIIYEENQTETELNSKPAEGGKVLVCRSNRKGDHIVVSVVAKRVLEGDVILDADGDGYFKENLCGVVGLGIDCDDTNPAINSGAAEICGDGLDNNCDGVTDEDCIVGRTYVPDDNFEQALIDLSLDDVLDDYVDTANINTVTELNVSFQEGVSPGKIANLRGIGGFTALQVLTCYLNNFTSLDFSQNTNLVEINCGKSGLTSINLSKNLSLGRLYCLGNNLEILNLNENIYLNVLECSDNINLTGLDLSNNTYLTTLWCINNPALTCIQVNSTQLASIPEDWHTTTASYSLNCGY